MSERDELAALIYGTEPWTKGTAYDAEPYEWSELDEDDKSNWLPQVDAILAAGYAKIPTRDYLIAAGWTPPATVLDEGDKP